MRQVLEGGLTNQQQRIAIGERHLVVILAVARLRHPRPIQRHLHQACRFTNKFADPGCGCIACIGDPQGIAPDRHATQFCITTGQGYVDQRMTRRTEGQAAFGIPQRRQLAHLRHRTLGQETTAGFIHQHPAAIAVQTEFIETDPLQRLALGGLQRITIQRAQTQHGQLPVRQNATLYELDH
ncbi:hypothetical protein D3C75_908070 [compost metagenome]